MTAEKPEKSKKVDWSGELIGGYDPAPARAAAPKHAQEAKPAVGEKKRRPGWAWGLAALAVFWVVALGGCRLTPTLSPSPAATAAAVMPTAALSTPTSPVSPAAEFTPSPTPTPPPPAPSPTPTATPRLTPTPGVSGERHALTVNKVGEGVVTQSPPPGADGKYSDGTVVTLGVGVLPAGWVFDGWSGAVSSRSPSARVVMDSDKVVTATFREWPGPVGTPVPTSTPTVATPRATSTPTPRPPPPATPALSLLTPYVDSADLARIGPFSADAGTPLGLVHQGIDFFPSGDLKPFQAVSSGEVASVRVWQNDRSSNWQVNVSIRYDSIYSVAYAFEPFSTAERDGEAQRANILVSVGQRVEPGAIIGRLVTVGSAAHVDFGLLRSGERICPEPYFTPEARESIMSLIRRERPDGQMCFTSSSPVSTPTPGSAATATSTPGPSPSPVPVPTPTPTPTSVPLGGWVRIDDPTGDWGYPPMPLPNVPWGLSSPQELERALPVPFIDLKSLAVRAEGDTLFVRYHVAAPLPRTEEDFPVVDGQRIAGFTIWMPIDVDNNNETGGGEWGAEAWLLNGWFVLPDGRINEEVTYFFDPAHGGGNEPFGFYRKRNASLVSGGAGYDYLEVAYPLSDLGLEPDQVFSFGVFARALNAAHRTVSGDFLQASPSIGNQGQHALRLGLGLVGPPVLPTSPRPPGITSLPSCGDREELFTTYHVPLSDVAYIAPLGNINPPGHTFPTPHIYTIHRRAYGADGQRVPLEVPVVAPGDMKILVIWFDGAISDGQVTPSEYKLFFSPCREFTGYFVHLISLAPRLAEQLLPPFPFSKDYGIGDDQFHIYEKPVEVEVRAGELLGTAGGTLGGGGPDFGARDYRTPPLSWANPSRWPVNFKHVVCPADYFAPLVADAIRALFGGEAYEGRRTAPPVCGEVAVDRPGSAQGIWFPPGARGADELVSLALVPNNIDPALLVFSVGTSIQRSGLPPGPVGGLVFTPASSGLVNRDFKDVTADGRVYCYENLIRNASTGERLTSSIIVLQLTSPTTLRIERQSAATCGSGPWTFGTTYTDFER